MKKILFVLSFLLLMGCSSMKSVRVQNKSIISVDEKSVFLQMNSVDLSVLLYEYFDLNGWEIYETADNVVTEVDDTTKAQHQTRATYDIKYSLSFQDYSFPLLKPLYGGYVSLIDLRTGKLTASVRFNMSTEEEIFENFVNDMEHNIIFK